MADLDEKILEYFAGESNPQSKSRTDTELIISLLEVLIAHLKRQSNNVDLGNSHPGIAGGILPPPFGSFGQQIHQTSPPQATWIPPSKPHKNDVLYSQNS